MGAPVAAAAGVPGMYSYFEWLRHVTDLCQHKPVVCTVGRTEDDCVWVGRESERVEHERTCPSLIMRDTLRGYKRKIQELTGQVQEYQSAAKKVAVAAAAAAAAADKQVGELNSYTKGVLQDDKFWSKQPASTCILRVAKVPFAGSKEKCDVAGKITMCGIEFDLLVQRTAPSSEMVDKIDKASFFCGLGIKASKKPLPGGSNLVFRLIPWHPVCHYEFTAADSVSCPISELLMGFMGRMIPEEHLLQCITPATPGKHATLSLRLQAALISNAKPQ